MTGLSIEVQENEVLVHYTNVGRAEILFPNFSLELNHSGLTKFDGFTSEKILNAKLISDLKKEIEAENISRILKLTKTLGLTTSNNQIS